MSSFCANDVVIVLYIQLMIRIDGFISRISPLSSLAGRISFGA